MVWEGDKEMRSGGLRVYGQTTYPSDHLFLPPSLSITLTPISLSLINYFYASPCKFTTFINLFISMLL